MPDHDPTVLRAISHPVRNRILNELSATGPMRAADIARELGVPANQASFHLRQLAKYGLVQEDPEAARDKRDRVWKASPMADLTIDIGQIEKSPGGKAASSVFRRNAASWAHVQVDRAYEEDRGSNTHRSISEYALKLSKTEALELSAELGQVLDRWSERTRGRDPGRDTYLFFSILQPHPDPSRGSD